MGADDKIQVAEFKLENQSEPVGDIVLGRDLDVFARDEGLDYFPNLGRGQLLLEKGM